MLHLFSLFTSDINTLHHITDYEHSLKITNSLICKTVELSRGVGRGALLHALPPWAPKAPFAIVWRPPIANVFTGNM